MQHTLSAFYRSLRWLVMLAALTALSSQADEFSDASQLVRSNRHAEALVMVDSFLVSKPADPRMRFLKGVIQRHLDQQDEAIATFTSLTQDYPELAEPYNNLAVLHAAQGQYEKARAALDMAIRNNPGYATAYENLGDVYARLASQAYDKALQLDSGNSSIAPKLAHTLQIFQAGPGQIPVKP